MPSIGGVPIQWDENKPAGQDSLGIGDDQIRSDKTAIRSALAAEHIWPSTGGPNTGAHVLGSARPFVGLQSTVSSSGSDGRLMWCSDTSNFFHVGSGGSAFIGGAQAVLVNAYPGAVPQRAYWALEAGQAKTSGVGVVTVTYSAGFNGLPYITLGAIGGAVATYATIGSTNNANQVEIRTWNSSGAALSSISVNWQSLGTRNF